MLWTCRARDKVWGNKTNLNDNERHDGASKSCRHCALSSFWEPLAPISHGVHGPETPGRFKRSDRSGSWSGQVIRAVLQRQREKEGRLSSWSKGYISHAGEPSCKTHVYVPIAWSWSWRGRRKSGPVGREVRRAEARIRMARGAAGDARDNPANMSVRHDLFRTLRELERVSPRCLSAGSDELSRGPCSPSPPAASGIPFASSNDTIEPRCWKFRFRTF